MKVICNQQNGVAAFEQQGPSIHGSKTELIQPRDEVNGRRGQLSSILICICCIWLTAQSTAQGQLLMDFQGPTLISPSSLSISLSVKNTDLSDPVSVGGVNFFVSVEPGGPTMSTTAGVGVNLLTGTLFSGALGGHKPINQSSHTPLSQGWGIAADPAVSIGPGQTVKLATITFDASLPASGSYSIDFGGTSFPDPTGENFIPVNPLNGTLTVVPEPQTCAMVVGFGLIAAAIGRRFFNRSVS